MTIVCISDTHLAGDRIVVPDGDVLLHCGDHTFRGTERETEEAMGWLASLPHPRKLFIAGNHDFFFDREAPATFRSWYVRPPIFEPEHMDRRKTAMLADFPGLTYLEDSSVTIEGLTFYGAPWQPWFWGWAFNLPKGDDGTAARATWAKIPDETDVLLTHGPPAGIRDRNLFDHGPENHRLGCPSLRARVERLPNLKLHAFGHIHGGYGVERHGDVAFVNAAICTEDYDPTNAPIVVEVSA